MKKISFLLTCIGLLSFTSCVDKAYDLDNIDPTIAIGGDSISMPFVNSMKLYMKDIIDTSKNKLLKVNEQGYYIETGGTVRFDIPSVEVPPISDQQYAGKSLVFDMSSLLSTAPANGLQSAPASGLHAQAKDSIVATFSISFPKEISSLDSVFFNATTLNVHLDVAGFPDWSGMKMTGKVYIPSVFIVSDPAVANNVWTFTEDITSTTTAIDKQMSLAGLLLSGRELGEDFKINEKLVYEIALDVPQVTVPITATSASVTPTLSMKHIVPDRLKGVFDVSFDKTSEVFDLGKELKDILGEYSVIDIEPVIRLDLQSNLGIPMLLDANISAINKGVTGDNVTFGLWTEPSPSPLQKASAKFWISGNSQGKPSGYNYVEVPGLSSLIGNLPEQVGFSVEGGSKPGVTSSYVLNTKYDASVKYDINVPLAFGPETLIAYKDTVDLDAEMEDLPSSQICAELYGTVKNSIPLAVSLIIIPADAQASPLAIDPISVTIKAGKADGSAVSSSVSARITDKKGEIKKMKKAILSVAVTSEGSSTPIKPDNGLDITLKLRFPGGIIIEDSEK